MFSVENFLEKYPPSKDCIIRRKAGIIGDKWSMLVLFILKEKSKVRFNELCRDISGISPKVLSDVLKNLEKEQLISRKVYPEVPPKVEYFISDKGERLMPILLQLMEWIDNENWV